MYKDCKNQRSLQRSHHIAQCLLDMMERQSFSQITVSSLCDLARIPRKSFYRYFDTKDDVFHLIVDTLLGECISFCQMSNREPIPVTQERLELCFHFWLEHRSVLDAICRSQLQPILMIRTLQYYDVTLGTSYALTNATDSQMQNLFCITGLFSIIFQWHNSGYDRTPAQMAQLALKLLKNPLVQ